MRAKKGKQQAPPTTLAEAEVVTAPPPPPEKRQKTKNKQTQTNKKKTTNLCLSLLLVPGFFGQFQLLSMLLHSTFKLVNKTQAKFQNVLSRAIQRETPPILLTERNSDAFAQLYLYTKLPQILNSIHMLLSQ